jgi:nitroreductase
LEAARWAASSNNEQPWRFIIARSEEDRQRFLSFLMPANQEWAKTAPVLVLILSKKTFSHNGKENRVYGFDAGTASGYMTLGATLCGLYAHGMAGFDQEMSRAVFGIPEDFEPIAAFAIGHKGDINLLPEEVRKREIPSGRRPVQDSIMEGRFVEAEEKEAEAKTENS